MESISYYLRGLHRNVRKLVEVMDTESKSLEQIQLSALRVGYADEPAEKTTALAAHTPHQDKRVKWKRPLTPRTVNCYLCKEEGHRVLECPELARLQAQVQRSD